jgi:ferredoxin--NADP+ reductase
MNRMTTTVLHHRAIGSSARELRLARPDFTFRAGELITLFGEGDRDQRDYTIASGENDPWIDVLYRLVPHGALTPQLVQLQAGDNVSIAGPYGTFTLRDPERRMVFIATGTGIAPAHSFIRTNSGLNLQVVHGVRKGEDLFYRESFSACAYQPCVSGEAGIGFHGRLTAWLAEQELDTKAHYYLCGANEMIYEVQDLLTTKNIGLDQLFTEPYYYRADD